MVLTQFGFSKVKIIIAERDKIGVCSVLGFDTSGMRLPFGEWPTSQELDWALELSELRGEFRIAEA
jgi:hypothetical protein